MDLRQASRALAVLAGIGTTLAPRLSAQTAGDAGLGALVPARVGPFELRGGGTVDRIGSSVAPRTTLTVRSAISLPFGEAGANGLWLGASAMQAHEIDTLPVRPLFEGGMWRSYRSVTVSVGTAGHTARLGGHPSHRVPIPGQVVGGGSSQQTFVDSGGSPSKVAMWSDVEAGMSWTRGMYRMDAVFGTRPAVDVFPRALWGRAAMTMQINQRFAVVAGVGTQPVQIGLGVPSTRSATLALHVTPPRRGIDASVAEPASLAAFSVRPAGAGGYIISYRVRNAHRVELSGDFNNWKPVELQETQPGVWTKTVTITPGTHHVNVRVDGGDWTAPPDVAQAADEFNGVVGIVVIP